MRECMRCYAYLTSTLHGGIVYYFALQATTGKTEGRMTEIRFQGLDSKPRSPKFQAAVQTTTLLNEI
jgi:hypothetical protein